MKHHNKLRLIILLFVLPLLIVACANPKFTALSPDVYQIQVKDTRGVFGDPNQVKDQVLKDAKDFAFAKNKELVPISFVEIPPAPRQFHTITYRFRLIEPQYTNMASEN